MPDDPPSQAAGRRPAVAPLGRTAARGFALFFAQAAGVKVINVVGQIVLSSLLLRQDYGYVGLAYTIASFASLIQQGGVREIMIRRGRRFRQWANPAFWFAMALGAASALLMVAAAPLAARFFQDPRLTGMVLVLAAGTFLNALSVVPEARLTADLRFRYLASTGLAFSVAAMLLSVALAAAGFGAYSFILPIPAVAILRAIAYWQAARPPIRLRMQIARWRFMASDSGLLLLAAFFTTVTWQGDYIILGRMYPKDVVGLYFWAFNLSTQSLQLLAVNMAGVLLPSISRLQEEPQRQHDACVRALRALLLVAVPACFLQAALADPLVRLVFRSEWHGGIPLVAILSVGWSFNAAGHSTISILKAQGRFATLALFRGIAAALFVACVYAGARAGAAEGAAWGVAAFSLLIGPASVLISLRPYGTKARTVAWMLGRPIGVSALVTAAVWGASRLIPAVAGQHLWRAAFITAASIGLYVPLLRWIDRAAWDDVWRRGRSAL